MKRKVLLITLLLGCVVLTGSTPVETFKGAVGLQLYSLRDQFKKDVPGTLVQVRAFGITHVELAGTYGVAPEKFKQEEAIRASHILFRVPENADAATKKKAMDQAQSVLKEARAGADFAALAKKHSGDGSAQQGGDLNFFTRGQMVGAFERVAFELKPGDISDLVETPFGFHIIKVIETQGPHTATLAEVGGQIKNFLEQGQRDTKLEQFVAQVKSKSKIEILV